MKREERHPFALSGRLVDRHTHAGLPHLTVEAWGRAAGNLELLDAAVSGPGGEFVHEVTEDLLTQLFGARPVTRFFRVFSDQRQIADTEGSIEGRIREPKAQWIIPVDPAHQGSAAARTRWTVRGRITGPSGSALAGVHVRVFDRTIGKGDTPLGEARSDGAGLYRVSYAPEQLGRTGKPRGDLLVVVIDDATQDTKGQELAARLVGHAPPNAVVDLLVAVGDPRGPSEFERLASAVAPALGGVSMDRLSDEDIALAARGAGLDPNTLRVLVLAHRLARGTALPAHVVYGLLRWGLPAERSALLTSAVVRHRGALVWATEKNIIPAMSAAVLEAALSELRGAVVGVAFEVGSRAAGSLGDLIATVLPGEADQRRFLDLYVRHEGPVEAFWESLVDDPAFAKAGVVPDLQLTFQLGALTRHHLSLLRYLQKRFRGGELRSLRDLARLTAGDWERLLAKQVDGAVLGAPPTVPGETAAEKIQNYASVLAWTLEAAFPGVALAGCLGTAGPALAGAIQVLSDAPGFELGRTRVGDYLGQHPEALAGATNQGVTTAQLEAMERLHKLTPSVSEIKALMDLGVDSAQSLVRLGRAGFERLLDGTVTADRAASLYTAARKLTAASHAAAARYHAAFNGLSTYVLPKPAPPSGDAGPRAASFTALFGSLDFCACGHCRSVYSPAAYLVDLLQFLDRQSSTVPAVAPKRRFSVFEQRSVSLPAATRSARDLLLDRRPDIASLELSCENTDTPLPYVDLVNEILEYAVANASLTPDVPFPDHLATEGTATELAVEPQPLPPSRQIVRDTAYEILASRPWPWRLPFDRALEEARLDLETLGVPRVRLLEAFRRSDGVDPGDTALRIALERLRLSETERRLVTGTFAGGPWRIWGLAEAGNAIPDPSGVAQTPIRGGWIEVLQHVAVLLHRTGVTYEELAALVRTRFVSPTGALAIEAATGADPLTCKTAELRVASLDAAALDRIHRFIRLRRALGWTSTELDQAITALGSVVDDALLIKLSHLVWLQEELGVPVAEMLGWWARVPGQEASGVASLARALDLSLPDLGTLCALSGLDVRGTQDPEVTRRFVDAARAVRTSRVEIASLDYLLRHVTKPSTGVAPEPAWVENLLAELATGLDRIALEAEAGADARAGAAAESFVLQRLGEALTLDDATTTLLLTGVLAAGVDPARRAISDFLGGIDGGAMPSEEQQRRALLRIEKIAVLLRRMKITADEVRWVLTTPWLDWNALPTSPAASGQPLFDAWLRLVRLLHVRDTLPAGKAALARLFRVNATGMDARGEPVDLLAEIAGCTGWSDEDLRTLAGPAGWFAAPFADLGLDQQIVRLAEVCALLARLGAGAAQVLPWIAGEPTPAAARATAAAVRDALKAKYDEQEWPAIARPSRDALRERRRSALADVARWERGHADLNALSAEILVDVERSAGQLTSRIQQAIGSVQRFVQRALLRLEPDLTLDEEAAREWAWMKSYRVWEANRKVFLYPENWIEPGLRDDKTPLFKALENELLQSDLDQESAERAFLGYLEKLDEIARLEVMGMVRHQEGSGTGALDVLHVVARTRGTPRVHFHRRHAGGAWTPWEKIDLDIQSEHLIPVVYERRLILFWALIEEKPEDDPARSAGSLDEPGLPPSTVLEVRLAGSEYVDGKWTARRLSDAPPLRVPGPAARAKHLYFQAAPRRAWTRDAQPELVVRCLEWVFNRVSPTTVESRVLGELVLSGCRGRWALHDFTEEARYFMCRRPGWAEQDRMAIVESDLTVNDGQLHLLAGELDPGPGKELGVHGERLTVLGKTPGSFRIVFPHVHEDFLSQDAFFYEDTNRSFFVTPMTEVLTSWHEASRAYPAVPAPVWDAGGDDPLAPVKRWASSPGETVLVPSTVTQHRFRFAPFYHPFVCDFIGRVRRHGLPGLFDEPRNAPSPQRASRRFFETAYEPTEAVGSPHPVEEVDFSPDGAMSIYNWELFFHAPLLIAQRLGDNQRFEEARRWMHTIFNPTTGSTEPVPQRFWKTPPFAENNDLATIDELLAGGGAVSAQIDAWRRDPFNPHRIARMRPLAYQKAVVMRYVDLVIHGGDQLFRQDTPESTEEALQRYLLAAEILGPRPRALPPRGASAPRTYRELAAQLDAMSNAMIPIENWVAPASGGGSGGSGEDVEALVMPALAYFCVPPNDELLGAWDTVADRLFKLRHGLNFAGTARPLPLFAPPIDPALLVRAAAAGVAVSTVLGDLGVPAPHHRFPVLLQKANELCAEVKGLGQALLAAREKSDAEALARLRAGHEVALLDAVRQVKERQVVEAGEMLAALEQAREMVSLRHQFYRDADRVNAWEVGHLAMSGTAAVAQAVIEGIAGGAAAAHLLPTVTAGTAGWAGSPVAVTTTVDGSKIGTSMEAGARAAAVAVSLLREAAAVSATLGGYQRRWDEWKREEKVTACELQQIDKQLAAAALRVAIAEKELAHHGRQAEQARAIQDTLRDRYSSQELYDWMGAQLAGVYFQAFQLAYDLARRAENAFRFERAVASSAYIQSGHWDSRRGGLLAGERLSLDLKRLEMAYMERDTREYEITKGVSLMALDPQALLTLKATGQCLVRLPERLFDMDYPGQFLRRLKSVSLTLPCVVGQYASVNCTLTLLSSKVRTSSDSAAGYAEREGEDARFAQGFAAVRSIVTSHAQDDSGMFEMSFRDERYLPFEGAGAVSQWRIELPRDTNAFDPQALSDVLLQVRYTARDGGEALRAGARAAIEAWLQETVASPLALSFSLRQELPTAWSGFFDPDGTQTLPIDLDARRFPFQFRGRSLAVRGVALVLIVKPGVPLDVALALQPPGGPAEPIPLAPGSLGLVSGQREYASGAPLGAWILSAATAERAVLADALHDVVVVARYSVQ